MAKYSNASQSNVVPMNRFKSEQRVNKTLLYVNIIVTITNITMILLQKMG